MTICRADQVWALDATFVWMAKGFVYLTVVMDRTSRKVLADTKVAITLESCHAVEVLHEAFTRYGTPEIISTDQGSLFTAEEFVQAFKGRGSTLSMDGGGSLQNNVFVERSWKSVKCEEVCLDAYDSVNEARKSIMRYLNGSIRYLCVKNPRFRSEQNAIKTAF